MLNIVCGVLVWGIVGWFILGFIGMIVEEAIISMKHYVQCKDEERAQ